MSKAERKARIRPMNADERERFLTEARGKYHGVLFETLLKTGLRPSESYALQPDDIDWKRSTLRVEKSIERGTRAVKSTKTSETRKVHVSPELLELLRGHAAAVRKRAFKDSVEPTLLFPSETWTTLDHHNVARTFQRRLKDAELAGFRLYDLRHTFASQLLAKGAPLTYAAHQLGHANPTTTLSHYSHWIPGEDRGYAALLDESAEKASEAEADFHHISQHAS